jgi:hypothetical protein
VVPSSTHEPVCAAPRELQGERWLELGVYADERDAHIEPFSDPALDVSAWWRRPMTTPA